MQDLKPPVLRPIDGRNVEFWTASPPDHERCLYMGVANGVAYIYDDENPAAIIKTKWENVSVFAAAVQQGLFSPM